MKLLMEQIEDVEFLVEGNEGSKSYFITGPFLQAEIKNGNQRIYPRRVIENAIGNFQNKISEKRALGELNHPSTPTVNLDRVSHLITELKMDGNTVYGKAKILDTPMGKIARNFLDEGIKLGVSSRGLGSIKESKDAKIVQDDFHLMTVDIVSDPSGPGCYVESMMEAAEWRLDESGNWIMAEKINRRRKTIKQIVNKEEREQRFLRLFEDFLRNV